MAVLARPRMTLEEFLADPRTDERAEFLFGEVYEPMPESYFHYIQCRLLVEALSTIFGADKISREYDLQLAEHRPRPDIVVLHESFLSYRGKGGYSGDDVQLVVEICLTSADRDYGIKDTIYATAGIPEYWIVDLDRDRVEKRTEPTPMGYAKHEVFFRGSNIIGIDVDRILGETSRDETPPSV